MNVLELFKSINTFVFDVDGVLTDGTLLVLPNGVMARRMNIKDGYALQLAVKKGYHIVIISGGVSPEVQERLNKLGVTHVYMQVKDKVAVLTNFMQQHRLSKEQVLFMGDDMPDAPALRLVGLPTCPVDAATDIKAIAQYISPINGGAGCARDVIEKVMKLQGKWNEDISVRAQ
jgi:3-deoxy-D-manno-octulosonate 8-phosphate phosphatase (KDO 8-P phosphatase)